MGRVGTIALLLALSACAPTTIKLICPPIVSYTAAEQAQAADELEAMPEGSIIRGRFMPDYGKLRAQIRACRG